MKVGKVLKAGYMLPKTPFTEVTWYEVMLDDGEYIKYLVEVTRRPEETFRREFEWYIKHGALPGKITVPTYLSLGDDLGVKFHDFAVVASNSYLGVNNPYISMGLGCTSMTIDRIFTKVEGNTDDFDHFFAEMYTERGSKGYYIMTNLSAMFVSGFEGLYHTMLSDVEHYRDNIRKVIRMYEYETVRLRGRRPESYFEHRKRVLEELEEIFRRPRGYFEEMLSPGQPVNTPEKAEALGLALLAPEYIYRLTIVLRRYLADSYFVQLLRDYGFDEGVFLTTSYVNVTRGAVQGNGNVVAMYGSMDLEFGKCVRMVVAYERNMSSYDVDKDEVTMDNILNYLFHGVEKRSWNEKTRERIVDGAGLIVGVCNPELARDGEILSRITEGKGDLCSVLNYQMPNMRLGTVPTDVDKDELEKGIGKVKVEELFRMSPKAIVYWRFILSEPYMIEDVSPDRKVRPHMLIIDPKLPEYGDDSVYWMVLPYKFGLGTPPAELSKVVRALGKIESTENKPLSGDYLGQIPDPDDFVF